MSKLKILVIGRDGVSLDLWCAATLRHELEFRRMSDLAIVECAAISTSFPISAAHSEIAKLLREEIDPHIDSHERRFVKDLNMRLYDVIYCTCPSIHTLINDLWMDAKMTFKDGSRIVLIKTDLPIELPVLTSEQVQSEEEIARAYGRLQFAVSSWAQTQVEEMLVAE